MDTIVIRVVAALVLVFELSACGPRVGRTRTPPATDEPGGGDVTVAPTDDCPGGVTSDGDCCVSGVACGASCIAANLTCHQPAGPPTPQHVQSASQIPAGNPDSGYRLHLIDVGTGLAILVQGDGFNLLFDGGSGDDWRGISGSGNNSRLLAYLWHAVGASGPEDCRPASLPNEPAIARPELTIDHVVLSHPHQDHGVFLDELLHCYDVDHVWDVGVVNDTVFYRQFVQAVAAEPGVHYRTVAQLQNTVTVDGTAIDISGVQRSTFQEGHLEQLDPNASFRVLHADAAQHNDFNENSLVLRVDLGDTSILLMGDAESGPREAPSAPVGDVEAHLLATYPEEIDVDILQVGHHGSMTSSRRAFLDAVQPTVALIAAGPKQYGSVVLPDQVVVDELLEILPAGGHLLRTDTNDGACPVPDRVGSDGGRPGGCDNWVLSM